MDRGELSLSQLAITPKLAITSELAPPFSAYPSVMSAKRCGLASLLFNTRQMIIITGGEPELCCRRHATREGGFYARPYTFIHVRDSVSLVQNACTSCTYIGKCEKGCVK